MRPCRLLPLLAALVLAACGSSDAKTDSGTSSSSAGSAGSSTAPEMPKPKVTVPTGAPPSQLVIKDLKQGTGDVAADGATLTVDYVGVLDKNGKEFDASFGQQPFQFQLGQGGVIPGWDQGLVGMKVGGRRELIIPATLGYGAQGSPPSIPPNAALVFVIDLLGVS